MKALKHFTIFLVLMLVAPFVAQAAVVISGTVQDSLSAKMIAGVTVKIAAPVCSTLTDTAGKFSLTIITTEIVRAEPKIYWNDMGFNFSGYSGNVQAELVDLSGKSFPSLPTDVRKVTASGMYFLRVFSGGQTDAYKIMNLSNGPAAMRMTADKNPALAKSAATNYLLTFSKVKYQTASRTVPGGTTNLNELLSPLGATGNLGISITPADSISITTTYSNN
jgi:hypothetical protein